VSQAVGQVFFRDSAERERSGLDQKSILENAIINLIKVSLLPAIFLGIIVPVLIPIFAGPSWEPVALIIQIMIPMYIVGFFTSPVTTLYNLRNLQSKGFIFFNVLLLVRVVAIVIGVYMGSAIGSVWLYSMLSVPALFLFPYYIVRRFDGSWKKIFLEIAPMLLEGFIIILVSIILFSIGELYTLYGLAFVCLLFAFSALIELRRVARRTHLLQV
jgi:lipopolysaccharide exporter